MKKWSVSWTEIYFRAEEIEAEDKDEALEIAKEMCRSQRGEVDFMDGDNFLAEEIG